MLQLKNLTIRHKKDLRPLLEDFSFTLNEGDKAVIISEEGNGKSTLLKLIYDKTLVEDYVEYTGEIIKPVSYTHLDVYKRQLFFFPLCFPFLRQSCG